MGFGLPLRGPRCSPRRRASRRVGTLRWLLAVLGAQLSAIARPRLAWPISGVLRRPVSGAWGGVTKTGPGARGAVLGLAEARSLRRILRRATGIGNLWSGG